jgi:hypothetical protein
MRRKDFFLIVLSMLVSFMLLCSQAKAQDTKVVKKGESVPFDGVLFTKELEKSIRMDMQLSEKKVDILSKLNELNEKEIDIITKRLELYQRKTTEMADREVDAENRTFLKSTIYFLSGAIITGLISYGINR